MISLRRLSRLLRRPRSMPRMVPSLAEKRPLPDKASINSSWLEPRAESSADSANRPVTRSISAFSINACSRLALSSRSDSAIVGTAALSSRALNSTAPP